MRSANPTEHQARIDRVTLEITLTGSYSLTADELTFGAKTGLEKRAEVALAESNGPIYRFDIFRPDYG